jgi:hypothetical protein
MGIGLALLLKALEILLPILLRRLANREALTASERGRLGRALRLTRKLDQTATSLGCTVEGA